MIYGKGLTLDLLMIILSAAQSVSLNNLKKSLIVFFVIYSNTVLCQQSIGIYDLDENTSKYLYGKAISTEEGTLDQPTEIYFFDSIFAVLNDFGDYRMSLFDTDLEFLNFSFPSNGVSPFDLFYDNGVMSFHNEFEIIEYRFHSILKSNSLKQIAKYPLPFKASSGDRFVPLEEEMLVIRQEPDSSLNRMVIVNSKNEVIKRFGKLREGVVDDHSLINNHLGYLSSLDTSKQNVFIGYKYANYIEKHSIKTGELLMVVHEIDSEFPPAYELIDSLYTYPESRFSYFSKLKVYGDKLYVLYLYNIPMNPKKEDEKMKLLIFSIEDLNLEDHYILDEDLMDFIIFENNELIGLCYYCDNPIRQYWLD